MSSVIVTWWTAGSLTRLATRRDHTLRQGCMVMASLLTTCGQIVLISQEPIRMLGVGARLSLTRLPFATCATRSIKV